ncbi:ribonuclease III (plasmid) [Azospirillum sp. TSH58]|uniref:ribonuclease III n=1 Tax=Azospirillum sp. TSH58 TaxID=664962 RepID=UPI000D602FEF|nr:ribonuclease III [Azospirillum sp. TSH58]AWJ87544.1 ribonuclease III [Azospirillum sp. TSH58]PWC71603.1 ribonuclease [Azospirillum sp. TSH58]
MASDADVSADSADLAELAAAIGHRFADPQRLADAVTHPSLMGLERNARGGRPEQGPGLAYERLEFLGDRVLGLVIAEWLLERFPNEREGALAKRHVSLVRREALSRVADALQLGRYLRLSPSEAQGGGRSNHTILADACEAVIGALYLDGGMDKARDFIRRAWAGQIDRAEPPPLDSKTALQEWAQGNGRPLPTYEMIEQSGPAHEPVFRIAVRLKGMEPVTATGPSKRVAERKAASALLRQLGVQVDD